jgi:type I restriction enzyme S subunit
VSFPRYPKYKSSGVEWLGDVPEGWEVKRSDCFLTHSRAQLDPKDFQGLDVFHYSIPNVQETGTGQLEAGSEIASGKQVVNRRVVLVSKLNPRKGTVCIAEPQQAMTVCSTEFVALEPTGCDIRYLAYLARTEGFRQSLESKVTSVTNSHQRANPADIYRFWNAWPALPEQTAIADFLDRETGKIDELVAEQRRLIELLKEKRQAVISHAVTKGLNPDATMKPSGIEWLGDVPAHWEVKPLRHVCYCLDGKRIPLNGTQRAEKRGAIPYWGANSIVDHVDEALFDEDLVFLGEDGAPFFDKTKPVAFFSTGKVWPNNHVHVLRPVVTHTGKFIAYALNITDYANFIDGSTRDKLTQGAMKEIPIPFPPLAEQIAIAEFLDSELARYETLTAEAQRAIDLLQERRTALISAAVTGQIDVRQLT